MRTDVQATTYNRAPIYRSGAPLAPHDRAAAGSRPVLATERLDRALTRVSDAPLRVGNALTLLRNGEETYSDWLNAIGRAQRWVHLENYIFQGDGIGQRFGAALAERAARGVRVRVLYDWFGSLDVPRAFWRQLRRAGVDVRPFNPMTLSAPLDVIHRDHRKLLAVDGTYASLGGVCIADPWLDRSSLSNLPYRDTAVRVLGPAVADLECAFARLWQHSGAALSPQELAWIASMPAAGDIPVRVIAQEPGRMRMLRVLQVLLAAVERRIWIADAYFLAAPILREALMAAAGDGIDVRLLLPATNDVPLMGTLSRATYRPLLAAGVRIWEYAGLMMHAKTTVADGWWARVGSTNLNVTGLLTNWELDLVAEDRQFGAAMETMFEADLADAREIRQGGARHMRPRPQRPTHPSVRPARRQRLSGSDSAGLTVARVGAALQGVGSAALQQHERAVGATLGTALLTLALLAALFPYLVAWPIAALSALFGSLSLLHTLHASSGAAQMLVKQRGGSSRARAQRRMHRAWYARTPHTRPSAPGQ